jgi:hypothetical protein
MISFRHYLKVPILKANKPVKPSTLPAGFLKDFSHPTA